MKSSDIDACALRFKCENNEAFNQLIKHYKPVCQKWFRYTNRNAAVERDDFNSAFEYLLFRSLMRYNPCFEQVYEVAISKFDRYFLAAVRKMAIDFTRRSIFRRKHPRRVNIDDVSIVTPTDSCEEVYIEDIISGISDPIDREIVRLRVHGNSREVVCDSLKLKLHQYRARLNRIKQSPTITSLLTDVKTYT